MRKYNLISTIFLCISLNAQELAFPKALGAAAYTTGGRGGSVYHVTNLNNSGAGSFRDAVSASNRIIVLDVSGTCELTSNLTITADNLTIAGQTAPAGGFTFCGKKIVFSGANNIIMRYIRGRIDYTTATWDADDTVEILNSDNIIIDHCSFSWGADETLTFVGTNDSITVQRTLIGEGKTGSIFGDSDDATKATNFSIFNNIWYNVPHRTPNINSNSRYDYINNIAHNWKNRLSRISGGVQLNYINNYLSLGALSTISDVGNMVYGGSAEIYVAGNYVNKGELTDPEADNWFIMQDWNGGSNPQPTVSTSYKASPFVPFSLIGEPITIQTALEAFSDVTTDCGANATLDGSGNIVTGIDNVDTVFLANVVSGTGTSYTSDGVQANTNYDETAHWSAFWSAVSTTPLASRDGSYDTDGDGIPNSYEASREWNPSVANNNTITHTNGYTTQLEEYLNLIDGIEEEPEDGNVEYELDTTQKAASKNAIQNKLIKM